MKQFFKFVFASMVGVLLAFVLAGFFMFLLLIGIASSVKSSGDIDIKDKSVLEITLDQSVVERGHSDPFHFKFPGFTAESPMGLNDILKSLDKAADDSKVKGVFLNLSAMRTGLGIATLEEIRNALRQFKTSGKFVYAYGEYYSQGAYYLASVADKIYIHPEGNLDFHGLRAKYLFFKGTLEKLDIEPEIIRHGKFKSAVEPFILDKMSDENRAQTRKILGSIWSTLLDDISHSRNIAAAELNSLADNMAIQTPEEALTHHMVDKIAYYDEMLSDLKTKSGLVMKDKDRFVPLKKYIKSAHGSSGAKKKIAVIYAVGSIESGEGDGETIGSTRIAKAIREARLDTSIKAIVMRVNSPGGSALASDVIWRETVLARKSKPFVVSMGDVAASGGYYISCAADTIVAQPNTITGSIGVFGLLFNTQKMFSNKLGITFDTVKTGRHSDFASGTRPLTAEERDIIQKQVERIYSRFTGIVADGRSLTQSFVDSIGQGRVWSGTDAKELGLVDVLGGVDSAIAIAAKMAKIEKYRIVTLPKQKPFFEKMMEDISTESSVSAIRKELGDSYTYYRHLKSVLKSEGIQARIPYEMEIY